MYKVVHAPNVYSKREDPSRVTLFLAGSIEMGRAIDWQIKLAKRLQGFNALILNPRRPDWDDSWEQSITHPKFKEQVEWELQGMEDADVVPMCFIPGTKSPISLLEFGLYAKTGKLIVYCPNGFWRKGNIDITAAKYGVTVYNDFDAFVKGVKLKLHAKFFK